MKTVEIEILGKTYYIKSSDPEELLEKAKYLNEQLEELNEKFNTVDQSKLFVLYLLILFDKYTAEFEKNKKLSTDLKLVEDLLKDISVD